MMKNHLNLQQNLVDFETYYAMLDVAHSGLDAGGQAIVNAQLILLLSNHIGELDVLREAFARARAHLDIVRPAMRPVH